MEIIDDGDIQISQGQARAILEIPGYKLHKPIEVVFFDEGQRSYRMQHTLPSPDLKDGYDIVGLGTSEESAASHLIGQLTERHRSPANELERAYLHSIMSVL